MNLFGKKPAAKAPAAAPVSSGGKSATEEVIATIDKLRGEINTLEKK